MSDHSYISHQSPTTATAAANDVIPVQEHLQNETRIHPLQEMAVQFKLSIGAVDDPLESEADAIADKVMRMPEQNFVQRKCASCEEEEEKLQRKPLASFIQRRESSAGTIASDSVSNQINASKGKGSSMDKNTQSFMQSRFGADFSDVKIHTGGEAIQMNRELNAKAFTVGNDIYFSEGQYNPDSSDGRHLLAHELTHVMQQEEQSFSIQRRHFSTKQSKILPASASGEILPFLSTIQQSFGHHDVSNVRANTNNSEAAAKGAEAFASGSEIGFAGIPSLHTSAHEAAHIVQQRFGVNVPNGMGQDGDVYEHHANTVADRVVEGQSSEALLDAHPNAQNSSSQNGDIRAASKTVQMRRIPPNIRALLTAAGGGNGPNFVANSEGVYTLINRAMGELSHAQKLSVYRRRRGSLTQAQYDALPRRERRIRTVDAILVLYPGFQLGDPTLLDMHARPATADATNILTLVVNANVIFDAIASGAQDASLTQVFGASSLATAKANYAAARTQMNSLIGSNDIVTDRGSGFSEEVGEGGLTGSTQISVAPDVIDNPSDHNSVVTLIHESMHTTVTSINDDIYNGASGFTSQSEVKKLANAAHYEVVPWRMLNPADTQGYPIVPATSPPTFQTFVPAGTTSGGVTAPARTVSEEAVVAAYELMRGAWALGLNLHRKYIQIFQTPTDWTTPQFGGHVHFNNSIPFWSKVQMFTVHLKTTINPASANPAEHPISQIDIALSEGMTRKLMFAKDILGALQTHADVIAFEAANATSSELSTAFPGGSHTNINTERDLLLKLAVRHADVGPITGNASRDVRVVKKMGDPALSRWDDILAPRTPASFPN